MTHESDSAITATTRSAGSNETQLSTQSPWLWVPSLYFAEGIPYVIVMTVSVVMYKRLGVSNSQIALYTSLLYLPWVIKPLWSPFVDVTHTKRWWIVSMQLLIGAGLAGVAVALPTDNFFRYTLAFFWMLAFSSATHDIAADGFYMLGLSSHDQAWYVGIRSTFYRLAMIAGQGLLVMLAGLLESVSGLPDTSVEVRAVLLAGDVSEFTPDLVPHSPGTEQAVLIAEDHFEIGLGAHPTTEVESLRDKVRQWNVTHGFCEEEDRTVDDSGSRPQWLTALENWIRKNLGPTQPVIERSPDAGGVALVPMRIAQPLEPREQIVVQFERQSGNTDFRVVEGSRFTVTGSNWQQPFFALIQLDRRLREATRAIFRARSGNFVIAWISTLYLMAALFVGLFLYHSIALPRPPADSSIPLGGIKRLFKSSARTFATFFRKDHIAVILAFLLFYRFSESQLVKLSAPFLLDGRDVGGLSLSTGQVGFIYGTIGVVMLTLGGILGGIAAARDGLRHWLWWMVLAINLPNVAYWALASFQPANLPAVLTAVAVEQFGYGFGFTAYMLYMLYVSQGEHETAHYALCTGFMALGMMLPGMFSGWLQELIGYERFFVWVVLATIPAFLVSYLIPLDANFGRRQTQESDV